MLNIRIDSGRCTTHNSPSIPFGREFERIPQWQYLNRPTTYVHTWSLYDQGWPAERCVHSLRIIKIAMDGAHHDPGPFNQTSHTNHREFAQSRGLLAQKNESSNLSYMLGPCSNLTSQFTIAHILYCMIYCLNI